MVTRSSTTCGRGHPPRVLHVSVHSCWVCQTARLIHCLILSGFCRWSLRQPDWRICCLLESAGPLALNSPLVTEATTCPHVTWPSKRRAGARAQGNSTNTLTLWLVLLLWVIKSFISDPGVSCLLLLSMKLWQADLLACKSGKISEPSQFWPSNNFKVVVSINKYVRVFFLFKFTEFVRTLVYCQLLKRKLEKPVDRAKSVCVDGFTAVGENTALMETWERLRRRISRKDTHGIQGLGSSGLRWFSKQ